MDPGISADNLFFQCNDVDDDDDVWNDTALLKHYEKAISAINKKISDDPTFKASNDENKTANAKAHKTKAKGKRKNSLLNEWKIGDHCRAIYKEENCDYEATIMKIEADKGICTVQFIGYLDVDEINLCELMPTNGRKARQLQKKCGLEYRKYYYEEQNSDKLSTDSYGEATNNCRLSEMSKSQIPSQPIPISNASANLPSIPPPPPPFPIPNVGDVDEALGSMLMSWYMSGYHTGYYQALKRSSSGGNHSFYPGNI